MSFHVMHCSALASSLASVLAPLALIAGTLSSACTSKSDGDDDGGGGGSLFDCSASGTDSDPRCNTSTAGTVGAGPKFTGGLSTAVHHGFIADNKLVLAVEFTAVDDVYGGIFTVDLATGDRALVSGKYKDPVNGDVSHGTSPAGVSLNQVRDVALGPDGKWYALAAESLQSERLIVAIDPATGNQHVVFNADKTTCTGISSGQVEFDPDSGIAVGTDGSIYVVLNNLPVSSGKGIARVASDGTCTIVTLSGAETTADNHGTGPDVIGSFLYNVTFHNNALALLQFNTHSSIITIDPATGNRTMVSVSPDKGTGPDLATDSMAIAADGTYWTYNGERNGVFGLVSVDGATGNRTAHDAKYGPAQKEQGDDRGIWVHPDGRHILLQYANAILIYDPATGNSNTLSY